MPGYRITVWELSGKTDEVESVTELECETQFQAIRAVDWILRGIKGHYKLWVLDIPLNRIIRESQLTWE